MLLLFLLFVVLVCLFAGLLAPTGGCRQFTSGPLVVSLVYLQYFAGFDDARALVERLAGKSKALRAFLVQMAEQCGGLTLLAHIIMPIQRIPRYGTGSRTCFFLLFWVAETDLVSCLLSWCHLPPCLKLAIGQV